MAESDAFKNCSYYLVRYVPHVEREECLNIGLLLYSPGEQLLDCLFTRDFRRVKRFHPQADLELLRALQEDFEQQIQRHEDDLEGFLRQLQQSLSHAVQLAPARPILSAEPEAELPKLFQRLVDSARASTPAADTRMRIKQQLVAAFRRAAVLNDKRLERRIPAERFTQPGDPFYFDFGYRPLMAGGKPNGHIKLIHALSLHRDPELAKAVCFTMGQLRAKEPAELTAIIEAWPKKGDLVAQHSRRLLEDAGIGLWPVADVDAFAATVRRELVWTGERKIGVETG